jgi:hypothetical protein
MFSDDGSVCGVPGKEGVVRQQPLGPRSRNASGVSCGLHRRNRERLGQLELSFVSAGMGMSRVPVEAASVPTHHTMTRFCIFALVCQLEM